MPQPFPRCNPVVVAFFARQNGAMNDGKQHPTTTDKARRDADERQRRQAEALRANLARRKAQARDRAGQEGPDGSADVKGGGGA